MSKRGENIYKRKDGRWEGRYKKDRINNKIVYGYVYGKTYKEVKNRLADLRNDGLLKTVSLSSSITLAEIAEQWLALKQEQLKWSSVVKYKNTLKLYILPEFGTTSVSKVTTETITKFNRMLLTTGGKKKQGLSNKTVTGIMSLLKNILSYAVSLNACTLVEFKCITQKQQKSMKVLSVTEQKILDKHLRGQLNLSSLGMMLCLYTGLRVGEICALKWKDISFTEQCISVHHTMQRIKNRNGTETRKTEIMISSPKSECSVRQIPIPDDIFTLLKQLRCSPETFFLTGTKSYIEPRTMQNRFKSTLKQCHIADFNFHALRHTFATRCIECGFDVKSLSEILGHASVNITMNRYVHPSMATKQRNMNKLTEFLAVS